MRDEEKNLKHVLHAENFSQSRSREIEIAVENLLETRLISDSIAMP